jgi:hypothetical protein
MCRIRALAVREKRFIEVPGTKALNGTETHKLLLEGIFRDAMTLKEAMALASSDDVRQLLDLSYRFYPVEDGDRFTEQHILIDADGNITEDESVAIAHGWLDDIVIQKIETIVTDLKTGAWEKDDPFERHLYGGTLARAYTGNNKIRFRRFYCLSGNVPEWLYEWVDGKVTVTGSKGKKEVFVDSDSNNPLLTYVKDIISQIEASEPDTEPGSQCTNWYGSPCQLLGTKECPPTYAALEQIPNLTDRLKKAFLQTKNTTDLLALPHDTVSRALQAHQMIEAGLKDIKKRIEQWSEKNGVVRIGEDTYGVVESEKVIINNAYALESMFDAELSLTEIAKAVSISPTSLKKLPPSRESIRNAILAFGIEGRKLTYEFKRLPKKEL